MLVYAIGLVIFCAASAVLTGYVAREKGYGAANSENPDGHIGWFILGFLLPVLVLLAVCGLPDRGASD